MEKESENLLKIAKYDLKTAKVALENALFVKVYENSHSALEKLLKSLILSNHQRPEKIHDLIRLAGVAVIENLQEDMQEILDELNTIYMSTRYPEDFEQIEAELSEEKARIMFKETKRVFTWLEKKLKKN